MRFDRLDILRYGALSDRVLTFRPDARLHIVYGPNEAGKSSALSAISDLLFGFPTAAGYAFLHDPASLRVGAEIVSKDGARLSFRRRRGRRNTLLAAGDGEDALPDDVLAPFLGTLGRDVFERAFGLDSASLRAGGQSMLKGGGEIGSLLFSAASGLTGLSDLRKSLEAEADAIYAPRRSKDRLFYQVLDAHEEARRAERDSELKSGDWKKLLAEQAALEAELADVVAERQETRRSLDRLATLLRLDPVIGEIDREREQLAAYEELAGLPAGFEQRLAGALEKAAASRAAGEGLRADAVRLEDDIAAIHVDEPLLAASPRILKLHSLKGSYLKAREDIARVRGELEDFDQRLAQSARRLGLGSEADLAACQPADADLARLKTLVEEGQGLDRTLAQLRERIEEDRDALRRFTSESAGGRLIDPKPWADRFAALKPDLNEISRLETLQVSLARAERDFTDAVSRILPPVTDVENLLASPLPDMAVLTHHRRSIDEARAASAALAAKLAALEAEGRDIDLQLAKLELGGAIVSREAMAAARYDRDRHLETLREAPDPQGFSRLAEAITEADRMADAALSDAERVSRHAQLMLRRREVDEALVDMRKAAGEAEIGLADAVTGYEDDFRAAGIVPLAPEKMIEWRRALDDLSVRLGGLNRLRDEAEALRLRSQSLMPALHALAEAVGLAAAELPPLAIGHGLERRLAEIAGQWSDSRATEGKRASVRETLLRLEAQEAALSSEAEAWRLRFSAALAAIGLAEDAGIDMALAALEVWRSIPDLLGERENRGRRVRGMLRDMEEFEAEAGDLAAAIAPPLAAIGPDLAADMLHERVLAATAKGEHRAALSSELERIRLSQARHAAEEEAAFAELGACAAMAVRPVGELEAMLAALRRRDALQASLEQSRVRFAGQAGGETENDVRAALAGFDRAAAEVELDRLKADEERLVERMRAVDIARAENDRRRRELETGIGAEGAALRKLSAETEARELARRWVVLKLAAGLLSSSMEAYRERQADPVMKRAGELFAGLTGGRFSRLLQLYDERDELQLAVERRSGEQVPLDGLSEGTGDQLYLALRLAFLEDYCLRNEPAPLILDDIFQTFDDERTAAGLRTLAAAGNTHQTLLFTHHTSVVETARRELGERVDVVDL